MTTGSVVNFTWNSVTFSSFSDYQVHSRNDASSVVVLQVSSNLCSHVTCDSVGQPLFLRGCLEQPAPDTPTPAPIPTPTPTCPPGYSIGTVTGYDNLGSNSVGSVAEFPTNQVFLSSVPVAAILNRDWSVYKYHDISIILISRWGIVQSWDFCSNCTEIMKSVPGSNFMLAIERRTLQRVFGVKDWQNFFQSCYQVQAPFDPRPLVGRYHLSPSSSANLAETTVVEGVPNSGVVVELKVGMPGWGIALVVIGSLMVVLLVLLVVVLVVKARF
eukprot:TRINITY_DN9484_c0_g1_i10.p1 TRINITY_DN9484_c0_g1~~TRINITY_DN9484_c0_g1_i10.p1  ORF type:complete len:272 (-),score=60.04 TRINITY_DN9484_c0_g1_i10:85-900(-)